MPSIASPSANTRPRFTMKSSRIAKPGRRSSRKTRTRRSPRAPGDAAPPAITKPTPSRFTSVPTDATTDEVMNYSLFAASKLLQKAANGTKLRTFSPVHRRQSRITRRVVSALYWIGKAKAREGKIDEAKQIAADTIKKYIGDPKRDAVEMLITQLAQLCAKKKRSSPEKRRRPANRRPDRDRGPAGANPADARATDSIACFSASE